MVPDGQRTAPLVDALIRAANPSGGWSYIPRKASRLEPTCWALLASTLQTKPAVAANSPHQDFLARCQRSQGWLVEEPEWPVNVAFNALVAFTWLNRRDLATDGQRRQLIERLIADKGVQIPQTPSYRQDNSLQGWSWLDATFSWVEPTAWGTLALHKAIEAGAVPEAPARARIDEAERLLIDRSCRNGGWNFGNANVMNQDLFPHLPTTAIALLALRPRRTEPAVARSLAYLESHWQEEPSTLALGLSAICLHAYGRPSEAVTDKLTTTVQRLVPPIDSQQRREPPNYHALAVGLTALSLTSDDTTFRV